jgi:hypothetical protein
MVAVLYDRSYVGSQNDLEENTKSLRPPPLPFLLANRVLRFAVVAFAWAKRITKAPIYIVSLKIG